MVVSFLALYDSHCHQLLDVVLRAAFQEMPSLLSQFWQTLPSSICCVLTSPALACLVGACDSVLYRGVAGVIMPSVLKAIPDSLNQVIRKFSVDFDGWLQVALVSLPSCLRKVKMQQCKRLCRLLRRQASLNQLCQAARVLLCSSDVTAQMMQDWRQVDLVGAAQQSVAALGRTCSNQQQQHQQQVLHTHLVRTLASEFRRLLERGVSLETYTEWLESLLERCTHRADYTQFCRSSHTFLLAWSGFSTAVVRDMTLRSAPSFGSFHLLQLLFDDFLLCVLEAVTSELQTRELLRNVRNDVPVDVTEPPYTESDTDDALHNISFLMGEENCTTTNTSDTSTAITTSHYTTNNTSETTTPNTTSHYITTSSPPTTTPRASHPQLPPDSLQLSPPCVAVPPAAEAQLISTGVGCHLPEDSSLDYLSLPSPPSSSSSLLNPPSISPSTPSSHTPPTPLPPNLNHIPTPTPCHPTMTTLQPLNHHQHHHILHQQHPTDECTDVCYYPSTLYDCDNRSSDSYRTPSLPYTNHQMYYSLSGSGISGVSDVVDNSIGHSVVEYCRDTYSDPATCYYTTTDHHVQHNNPQQQQTMLLNPACYQTYQGEDHNLAYYNRFKSKDVEG